nr:uncharacterized protein CFP56_13201 [Quercus suber]
MSRRPGPVGPDRAEQNRATLKQLVKLESNKSCSDCKRNKHPRWASWNLGVFICIRCSGIHRGMGTHISRVKSVDLDSWTDEQLQSMLKWGNQRANKYWEHKLAEGHVPNEAKIENFIRTKYDSRRWVMDGPMPDPSTLDDGTGDDDVPLNVVQEKAKMERSASIRNGNAVAPPPRQRAPVIDLFGDEPAQAPAARPSTVEPASSKPGPPKATAAAPKQRAGDSLLGMDFFGGTQSAPPARPSSTGLGAGAAPGRTDLKQSILSLYASKPAAATTTQSTSSPFGDFGGMQSPPLASPTQQQSSTQALGGLGDAFGGLSFGAPSASASKPAPFSGLSSPPGHLRQPSANKSSLSGGSFFDAKPAPPPKPTSQPQQQSFGGDFGDFSSAVVSPVTSTKSPPPQSSNMGSLFDLGNPTQAPPAQTTALPTSSPAISAPKYTSGNAFNLSQASTAKPAPPQASAGPNFSSFSNADAWGSNDAWATPEVSSNKPATSIPAPMQTISNTFGTATPTAPVSTFDSGWGDPKPVKATTVPASSGFANTTTSSAGFNVQQDEEFGGWSHASPVATPSASKASGMGGGSDDLFGNVWE